MVQSVTVRNGYCTLMGGGAKYWMVVEIMFVIPVFSSKSDRECHYSSLGELTYETLAWKAEFLLM